MKKFGIIGKKLTHSFSPKYFTDYFEQNNIRNHIYTPYEIQSIEEIKLIWQYNPELCGMNVTIPYKIEIIDFLSELSVEAIEIGAVNVIRKKGNQWVGHNTDGQAFYETLCTFLGSQFHYSALVLGSGGASKAVCWALQKLNIKYLIISRNGYNKYQDITKKVLLDHKLIINTTPLGMYPNVTEFPEIPYFLLNSEFYLYDLIYNPEKTLFLNYGNTQGTFTKNGGEMLLRQAELSWEYWSHN
jgi:shikimate dehydrogenase